MTIPFFLVFLFTTASLFSQNSESEKIYQSILKATFTDDKIELGKQLLKKNECKDGMYIDKLLKDSNYWNREAGIYLVGECNNPKLDKVICDLFIEDHMTRTAVKNLIQNKPNRYSKYLISIYKKEILSANKIELFDLYPLTEDADTAIFLQKIIEDQKSPDRLLAFKALMKHSKKPDDSFFRGYKDDKELRKMSIQWILENGKDSDYTMFKEILANPNSSLEELANACMAVQKWGNQIDKKSTYLRFLREDNQRLLPIVFSVFDKLIDDEIFQEVSKLSITGKTQLIRTEAILQLKNFTGTKKFAYIILFLQEEYQTQTQYHSGDALANLFTFGIHGIFKGLQEKQKKDRFYSIQKELIPFLQKETRESFTTASEWKVWAKQKKLLPITITYD